MKAKKLLAGVLTCTMVFAMGMTAFAADETVGNVNAEMKKSYKLEMRVQYLRLKHLNLKQIFWV